ncbi:hypothetical protein IU418_26360 [Nocardia farcinica]|uniref:hypothetical protein n=1 Tax=Nocardia farcinica TaxID=37329 RepID=UPI0009C8F285|nr:hypothetical protein [Nocardia farcinica]MBF6540734.1 hypothetical protein [Nocardia farcinica]SLG33288.1 Uncharacterised protein [Mycobacteroides abscessus subsp. abscessus]
MTSIKALAVAAAVTLAALGLTACGDDRWCEHDDTDTRVADSYCAADTPGYEWEPDFDDHHQKKPATKKPTPTKKAR